MPATDFTTTFAGAPAPPQRHAPAPAPKEIGPEHWAGAEGWQIQEHLIGAKGCALCGKPVQAGSAAWGLRIGEEMAYAHPACWSLPTTGKAPAATTPGPVAPSAELLLQQAEQLRTAQEELAKLRAEHDQVNEKAKPAAEGAPKPK